MNDKPYTLIIEGNGNVTERKLDNHSPGKLLKSSIKIVQNSVKDGKRKVILTRAVKGATADHFSFPQKAGNLNLISAIGDSEELAYHRSKTTSKITLIPGKEVSCVCQPDTKDYLTYMNTTTLGKEWD